jgi:hypothetical protein
MNRILVVYGRYTESDDIYGAVRGYLEGIRVTK